MKDPTEGKLALYGCLQESYLYLWASTFGYLTFWGRWWMYVHERIRH